MITVILILTIFNTGLILLMAGGLLSTLRQDMAKMLSKTLRHVDETYEALGTAIFNMDSIKQKVNMSGKVEL